MYILNKSIKGNYNYIIKCSRYTLGIYAMHYIIISILKKITDDNIIYSVINVFIVFGVSYLCCYIVEKIPILRKIINNNYIK
jgi:surface polysaccharide O-acyltransferase-like enzyme